MADRMNVDRSREYGRGPGMTPAPMRIVQMDAVQKARTSVPGKVYAIGGSGTARSPQGKPSVFPL